MRRLEKIFTVSMDSNKRPGQSNSYIWESYSRLYNGRYDAMEKVHPSQTCNSFGQECELLP